MAITSAFQADDRGPIPLTRSTNKYRVRKGSIFVIWGIGRRTPASAGGGGGQTERSESRGRFPLPAP